MITINDIIKLEVDEKIIKESIKKAIENNFIDNLRLRHPNVQLDCKIRGYIGEMAIKNFFNKNNIFFDKTDYLTDGMGNIDIDLLYKNKYSLEIKTSLVPDTFANYEDKPLERIKKCIDNCDIKLIKRSNKIEVLKGDIHIQLYYADLRKSKDQYLSNLDINVGNMDLKNIYNKMEDIINLIYEKFKAYSYIERTYFVGWIDKATLINNIRKNRNKIWKFSYREFWECKLKNEAKKPKDIIDYLIRLPS